ncbi:MAG: methionyl-tRNA formyltransferase [Acidobacteriota bacterium]|nr:methionyl-tRNA formyltransferase [Acidobacteriota bacterium]
MRIVFFGSPEAALPSLQALIEAGHEIPLIVTQPDKPAGRGRKTAACPVKAFAAEQGFSVIQPERIRKDETVLDRLREARPDIHVVIAYGRIIPDPILYLPRWKTLNVHFSLLPKYRGASPVQWAVLNGEIMTGVTIIELNDKMDEGDMLAAEGTEIGPNETAGMLEARLADIGAALLVKTLEGISRGSVVRQPQNHTEATYAPKIAKSDGLIDWTTSAESVERKVRAFQPWPTAFTFLGPTRIVVRSGRISIAPSVETSHGPAARAFHDPAFPPDSQTPPAGSILSIEKDGLAVSCGGGSAYLIEIVQPEGRTAMAAYAYAIGARIAPGSSLGNPDPHG